MSLGLKWLKADLHLHTAEDPRDAVDLPAAELLEIAGAKGFTVLAVTLHEVVLHRPDLSARARELGILLLVGAELRISGADVIVLNVTPKEAASIRTFDDLRHLRAVRGASLFVIAPHPYYPGTSSLGRTRLEANRDCFDAVELCHLSTPLPPFCNPNARARHFAHRHGLPLVGTSDSHLRETFGNHFSLVGVDSDADLSPELIFNALRAGRVKPVRIVGRIGHFFRVLMFVVWVHPWRKRQLRQVANREGLPARAISFCPSESAD